MTSTFWQVQFIRIIRSFIMNSLERQFMECLAEDIRRRSKRWRRMFKFCKIARYYYAAIDSRGTTAMPVPPGTSGTARNPKWKPQEVGRGTGPVSAASEGQQLARLVDRARESGSLRLERLELKAWPAVLLSADAYYGGAGAAGGTAGGKNVDKGGASVTNWWQCVDLLELHVGGNMLDSIPEGLVEAHPTIAMVQVSCR
jgi:hypothetical protein